MADDQNILEFKYLEKPASEFRVEERQLEWQMSEQNLLSGSCEQMKQFLYNPKVSSPKIHSSGKCYWCKNRETLKTGSVMAHNKNMTLELSDLYEVTDDDFKSRIPKTHPYLPRWLTLYE